MKHLKTQNSAPVYERWLDFMQFRNLLILNFVTFMLLLGMIGTHDYRSYHKTQLFLLVLNLVFAVFLCLKKGIFVHQNQLYEGLFLFGFPLESARVITSALPYLLPVQGTLSTHYQYTPNSHRYRDWEPNLDISQKSFTLFLTNADRSRTELLIRYTNEKRAQQAIELIVRNTHIVLYPTP